jgi:hypothetical protein
LTAHGESRGCVECGRAEWRHPDLSIVLHVAVIGKVTNNREKLIKASARVWIEGAQPFQLNRIE